ncbi:MAG: ribose 5-phosphate isomerase B [Syntrophales bacterium]|jgi:RpiB/LacA/LacB family sugar-phosphate isomerase|nr:ribose 5-phosphate isomerase B [Syntrophales bacterium]
MAADKIIIGADHAGFVLKEALKPVLEGRGFSVTDVGTDSEAAVDYPDFGKKVAEAVSTGLFTRGIMICGSGIGMSIVANRFPGVRGALCLDPETARLSRLHNDSNILVLAGRKTDPETAAKILQTWLETPFEGGRHKRRLDKITQGEQKTTG